MDLDNRLKDLNDLPVDGRLKKDTYEKIRKKSVNRSPLWKEIVLLSSIAVIALTLMILPSMDSPQQATSQSVEAIYAYENSKEGKFFARPSTLYLGVEEIAEPSMFDFFEHYTDFVQPSNMPILTSKTLIDPSWIDIVVLRNGEEERWKISRKGMLNVDTDQYFVTNDQDFMGEMIVDTFYSSVGEVNSYPFFIMLGALFANLLPSLIYKLRKKDEKSPLEYNLKFGFFPFLSVMSLIGWQNFVGPLYKPVLVIFVFLFLFITHIFLKHLKATNFVYRIEMTRFSVIMILLLMLFYRI